MSDTPINSGRSAESNQTPRVNLNPRTRSNSRPAEPEVHGNENPAVEQPSRVSTISSRTRISRQPSSTHPNEEPITPEDTRVIYIAESEDVDRHSTTSNSKQCWICFANEEDDAHAMWTQPCNCRGTTKWVHQSCLQQWVDEKQKDSRDKKVACPQCKTEYLIYFPQANGLVVVLDKADALIYRMCPFIAAGILVGSLYWTAVTYGAVTVMQVAGQAEATQLMERMEPAVLLTALPTIPVSLIVLKMFHWEDSLLLFLRKTSPSLPILNYFLPAPVRNESGTITENPVTDGMSCTRVFTGALLLPTIATICGNMFFQHIQSGIQRSIVGGITFIAVKGIIKMYHKQQVYKRLSKRKILDYTEENIRRTHGGPPAAPPRVPGTQANMGTSSVGAPTSTLDVPSSSQ